MKLNLDKVDTMYGADPNQYAHVTAHCWPENCMYGQPKAITVTFNLTKK